jgi:hypothetical protein
MIFEPYFIFKNLYKERPIWLMLSFVENLFWSRKLIPYCFKMICWILEKFRIWFDLILSSTEIVMKQIENRKRNKKRNEKTIWAATAWPIKADRPAQMSRALQVVFNLDSFMLQHLHVNGVNLPLLFPLILAILYYRLKHENYSPLNHGFIQAIKTPFSFLNL